MTGSGPGRMVPTALSERQARMALCAAVEPGSPEVSTAVAEHGAAAVWAGLADHDGAVGRRAGTVDLTAMIAATDSVGARFVIPGDPEWPPRLADLDRVVARGRDQVHFGGQPLGLWLRGRPLPSGPVVAIVGSRASTGYGESVTVQLAAEAAEAGLVVISGAAYGIDTAAHRGAVAGGGRTIAVLACGVDRAYPSGNAAMLDHLGHHELIISELPPGSHPARSRFLSRNRLIAAIAEATLIVEAGHRSGARNTASWAIELNRHLLAVPGPVTSTTSATPNRLIKERQAELCSGIGDLLEVLSPSGDELLAGAPAEPVTTTDALPLELYELYEALPGRGSMSADELALTTGKLLPEVLVGLAELAQLGCCRQDSDGRWSLAR
ncbi:DNA processing protein [Naumannella halotolerans]|uniref:DNA processing protein n=2 Tax=Naumannella halotolerans TaxID=993414 RepID=A0A4R7J6N6_9ACTN|nr:DNA processing protein [Naumannella halotolerans]